MRQLISASVIIVLILVFGCGKQADAPKTAPSKASTSDTEPTPPTLAPVARNASSSASAGPEQTVRELACGVGDGKPVVLWHALPASYQKDLAAIVREFAGKMDPEVWNKGFAVLRKAVGLLQKQKNLILTQLTPFLPPGIDKSKLSDNWDSFVGLLQTLVTCELSSLDELKKADIEKMLSGSAAKLLQQFQVLDRVVDKKNLPVDPQLTELPKLKTLQASLIQSDGDEVTLRLTIDDPRAKPVDVVFVKVEGKWIPKEMADNWERIMREARSALAQIKPDELAALKPMILQILDQADGKLDDLARAKSPEEFKKVIDDALQMILSK